MKSPIPDNSLLEPVFRQVQLLQQSYKKTSRAPAIRDLAAPLAVAIKELHPHAEVGLAFRSGDAGDWEEVIRGTPQGIETLRSLSPQSRPATEGIHRTPGMLVIVQNVAGPSLIGLVLAGTPPPAGYSDADILSLKLLLHVFGNALGETQARRNEKDLVFSLNHRILQLNSLIDTGIEVSALEGNEAPHRLALSRAASLTNASKGAVIVREGSTIVEQYTFPEGGSHPASGHGSIASEFEFASRIFRFELFGKESRSGSVPFEDTDQLLLDALTRQVHASLVNRDLLQQALERERIEQELSVAATIQQKILPASLPKIKGYDLAVKNIPSKSVGGDYYDCIPLPDGKYCLVVGDVSGKGVPAALLVSSLHAYLSAYLEGSSTIQELAGKLNGALYRASTPERFVTAFLAILTPATGLLESVSAGHNPVYLLRKNGNVEELKLGGLPLGVLDFGPPYESEQTTIGKGDRLLLYTDGVTEAENESHTLYEKEHPLPDFLIRTSASGTQAFVSALIADVKAFTGTAPQNDDITALCLSRLT